MNNKERETKIKQSNSCSNCKHSGRRTQYNCVDTRCSFHDCIVYLDEICDNYEEDKRKKRVRY